MPLQKKISIYTVINIGIILIRFLVYIVQVQTKFGVKLSPRER